MPGFDFAGRTQKPSPPATGNTLAQYTYEPFGNTTVTGTSTNPYQFTGRENDGTGADWYRARYYSPGFQRFISDDPARFAGGFNLYAYAKNDPVLNVDPLGLWPGFGATIGGEAFAGAGPGLGGSFSVGGVYFPSTNTFGGFASTGAFAGSNGEFGNYENNNTGGLAAGAGPGFFITNGKSINDLAGPFNTTVYALGPFGTYDFAYSPSTGVWTLNISGESGLGYAQYCTNTYTSPASPASFSHTSPGTSGRKDPKDPDHGCNTGF